MNERVLRHPRHADVASAIYGTILATVVVAGASVNAALGTTAGAVVVLVTSLVFWLAHIYANLLAQRVLLKRKLSRSESMRLAGEEWPLVQAGALLALILLLGSTGIYGRDTAFTVASWAGVASLFAWGVVYARNERQGVAGALLSGTFNAALGVIVIALKALVSH